MTRQQDSLGGDMPPVVIWVMVAVAIAVIGAIIFIFSQIGGEVR
jgi:hypothetical protein